MNHRKSKKFLAWILSCVILGSTFILPGVFAEESMQEKLIEKQPSFTPKTRAVEEENAIAKASDEGMLTVDLYINGNRMTMRNYLIEDTTYVPLRAFCDEMGDADIDWSDGVATVKTEDLSITARQNSEVLEANGRILYNSRPIRNIESRIYVPIRSLAKAYGLDVAWNGKNRSVYLEGTPEALESGSSFYDAEDLYWLSRIIEAESGGEIFHGKIAVGNVVINRKNHSAYPDTIYGVIFDRKYGTQFSPVAYGTIYNTPSVDSVLAAKACLDGYSINSEMIFFINPRIATNFWISQSRTYVISIGNHDFYK